MAESALKYAWMSPYKTRIEEAMKRTDGPRTYVPGTEIAGDSLRSFSEEPVLSGPLVCQLCDEHSITEQDFSKHKECEHAGEKE